MGQPGQDDAGASGPVPPGWYPDPLDASRQRHWDGTGWTDATRDTAEPPPRAVPEAQASPASPPPDAGKRRAPWPWVLAAAGAATAIVAVAVVLTTSRADDDAAAREPAPAAADDQDLDDAPAADEGPGWAVTIDVPDDAFGPGVEVVLAATADGGQPLTGSVARSPAFSVDAGGDQPAVPLTVTVPAGELVADEPHLVFLARWDPVVATWVPVPTEHDASAGVFVAELDHLSTFRFWEWQIVEDAATGLRMTGRQVADLYERTQEGIRRYAGQAREGFEMMLEAGTGWLGLDGASPPTCADEPTGFDLIASDDGEDRPLHACQQPGPDRDTVELKLANNRPYGMVISRPSGAQVRLERWPGMALDSGEAALYAFYEMFDSTLGLRQSYLPPGATIRVGVDVSGADPVRIEATSTPAFTGFDLAAELVLLIWIDDPGIAIDAINCLLAGHASLEDLVGEFGPSEFGGLLETLRGCLATLGLEVGGELMGVVRAMLATGPSLISNIVDTDWRRFEVAEHVELVPTPPAPATSRFYAVSFARTSQLFLIDGAEVDPVGDVRLENGTGIELTDVAEFDGRLYATSFSSLYELDPTTATATRVGSLGVNSANALAFTPDGALYAAGQFGTVARIDPATADTLDTWTLPGNLGSSGDLLADADGRLWLTTRSSTTSRDQLVLFDPSSGEVVRDGPQVQGPREFFGLTSDDEGLLVLAARSTQCPSGGLYRIDPDSDRAGFLACLGFNPGGATRSLPG